MASASAPRDSAALPHPVRDDSGFRLRAGLVLVLAAILFFARLGARALWSSEFRWAEIAREMLVTHNYFWPTINGHVYYDKPLGSYWLVIFSTPFTGGLNEAATRLPCAIAGLLAVALLMLLVRRLYDARTAILSGVILATSFSFVFFSRHASADVETITGELAALLLFNHNEERGGGMWVVGLWLIMAATSLTKGLLGFALPLLVIGAYSCLRDGWSQFFQEILHGSIADRMRTAHRAKSMVLQLVHGRRHRGWRTGVLPAVRNLGAHDGHAKRPRDGVSRKRRAIFPSVRPSRADLSLCLRNLRPDGAVVSALARGPGRNAHRCGTPMPSRHARIDSRWSISGRRSYFSRSRDRAAATTSCRFSPPQRSWSRELSRIPANFAR